MPRIAFLILLTLTWGCKPAAQTQAKAVTLTEVTVGTINGVKVGVSGIYKANGANAVNLTIDGELRESVQEGDRLDIKGTWKVAAIREKPGRNKGKVVLQPEPAPAPK